MKCIETDKRRETSCATSPSRLRNHLRMSKSPRLAKQNRVPMNRLAFLVGLALAASTPSYAEKSNPNLLSRGNFANSLHRFEKEKKGHVAFMGGSITEMNGYRPILKDWLKKRFPKTEFTFTNAGISSTCSTTGAFRLERDILNHGPVDLFFVEFAVNDDQDAGHDRESCHRGVEGILRHLRTHNPRSDVVLTYFVNPGMLKVLQGGKQPLPMAAHEEVLKHYDVSAVHLAKEVAERINAGTYSWAKFGGTHPKRPGNQLAANLAGRLLENGWKKAGSAKPLPHPPIFQIGVGGGRGCQHAGSIICGLLCGGPPTIHPSQHSSTSFWRK